MFVFFLRVRIIGVWRTGGQFGLFVQYQEFITSSFLIAVVIVLMWCFQIRFFRFVRVVFGQQRLVVLVSSFFIFLLVSLEFLSVWDFLSLVFSIFGVGYIYYYLFGVDFQEFVDRRVFIVFVEFQLQGGFFFFRGGVVL